MASYPMTKYGNTLLIDELQKLKSKDRVKIVKDIATAREHGDLKENAEYIAAREQQGFVEGRIESIENKLSNSQIIDVTAMQNNGKVIFGTTVSYKNMKDESIKTVQIVGEDEASIDDSDTKISIISPIARGLIGKFVNNIATVTTPVDSYKLTILTVEYK